ncbi:HAMP domain-containing protein [bacterium]|nr:HAMP domain-containing protein [bacterium]
MRRHSLYTIIFVVFGILITANFASVYFSISQHKKDLIETAIREKIHLAETLNESLASPIWVYRLALVPGMEKALIGELATFKDVKYIRVVNQDGTIYKSSIEKEWGGVVKEPDILKVISAQKPLIKDSFFEGEKIKLIIYPGYQNKTIWVGFTLASIEKTIRDMWIRDFLITGSGLLITILILIILLREIVTPLRKLNRACQKIREGNLKVKVRVRSKTEIGELADTFNKTVENLRKSKEALEKEKAGLEVKVQERTKELRKLTESLEEKVKERTKELQKRLVELERFQRLTVGRELRMIELKKEIKKLKKELEKYKDQKQK